MKLMRPLFIVGTFLLIGTENISAYLNVEDIKCPREFTQEIINSFKQNGYGYIKSEISSVRYDVLEGRNSLPSVRLTGSRQTRIAEDIKFISETITEKKVKSHSNLVNPDDLRKKTFLVCDYRYKGEKILNKGEQVLKIETPIVFLD